MALPSLTPQEQGRGAPQFLPVGRARRLRGAGLRPDGQVGGTTEAGSMP